MKSTTEAELLSLDHAAGALLWWKRFFGQLGYNPGHEMDIKCDNKQMVNHIVSKTPKLHTKLQHVDVRNHWLRETVQKGDIKVEWVLTASMPADGLTKPLEPGRHKEFIKQLDLVDFKCKIDVTTKG